MGQFFEIYFLIRQFQEDIQIALELGVESRQYTDIRLMEHGKKYLVNLLDSHTHKLLLQ